MEWQEVYNGPEMEARLWAGFLESEGISCKVIPGKGPNIILSNLSSFEAIIVPEDEVEKALRLLR